MEEAVARAATPVVQDSSAVAVEPESEKEIRLRKELAALTKTLSQIQSKTSVLEQGRPTGLLESSFDGDAQAALLSSFHHAAIPGGEKKSALLHPISFLEGFESFFNEPIERIIEGLPNADSFDKYLFHELRFDHKNLKGWEIDLQKRKVKESNLKQKLMMETKEKEWQNIVKETRKRQRESEMSAKRVNKEVDVLDKKKRREQDRLSKLEDTVSHKLIKEALNEKGKIINFMKKQITEEQERVITYVRAAYLAMPPPSSRILTLPTILTSTPPRHLPAFLESLPRIYERTYDKEILRMYEFMSLFKKSLKISTTTLPTMNQIQQAVLTVDTVPTSDEDQTAYAHSVSLLTNLASALCRPLASEVKKLLVTSNKMERADALPDDFDYPINDFTWPEIAKMVVLNRAYDELGTPKTEQTFSLRGQGSGAFSNHKFFDRDVKVGHLVLQAVKNSAQLFSENGHGDWSSDSDSEQEETITAALPSTKQLTIPLPSAPSCSNPDWKFFLHNLKPLGTNSGGPIKSQILKAIDAVQRSTLSPDEVADVIKSLKHSLSSAVFKSNASGAAKNYALAVLEKYTNEVYISDVAKTGGSIPADRNFGDGVSAKFNRTNLSNSSRSFLQANDDDDAEDPESSKRNAEMRAAALKRSSMRQTSFPRGCLGKFLNINEIDVAAALRDKYVRKSRKFMKSFSTKRTKGRNYDEGDGDDDEEEEADQPMSDDGSEEEDDDDEEEEAVAPATGDDGMPVIPTIDDEPITALPPLFLPTMFDAFAADVPGAPDTLRKLLAIVRTICKLPCAEKHIYPVSMQDSPKFYESIVRPQCLMDIGNYISQQCKVPSQTEAEVVLDFITAFQTMVKNTYAFNVVGSAACTTADRMSNVFERLVFDWLLAPEKRLIETCDDDRCVIPGIATILTTTILLCDRCEGYYDIQTLVPALAAVPRGDWFCPSCCAGRCWFKVDPRLKQVVDKQLEGKTVKAKIISCDVMDGKLMYTIKYRGTTGSVVVDQWSLQEVNDALAAKGVAMDPVPFADSICKSLGYNGGGRDHGVIYDIIPPNLDPSYSVNAAVMAATNSSFVEALNGVVTLSTKPEDRSGKDWVELFSLLVSQCTNSADVQLNTSEMEASSFASLEQRTKNIVSRFNELNCAGVMRQTYMHNFEEGEAEEEEEEEEVVMAEVVAEDEGGDDVVVVAAILDDDDNDDNDDAPPPPLPLPSDDAMNVSMDIVKTEEIVAADPEAKRRKDILKKRWARLGSYSEAFLREKTRAQLVNELGEEEADKLLEAGGDDWFSSGGLRFDELSCDKQVCDVCQQSDKMLGSPLMRFPTTQEWVEKYAHAACEQTCSAIASVAEKKVSVSIRIGGVLVTDTEAPPNPFAKDSGFRDAGMLELVPRNPLGFQRELKSREESGLPFITGSLSAHIFCAQELHSQRTEDAMAAYKTTAVRRVERDLARRSGHLMPVGTDSAGRNYWVLESDMGSLVVQDRGNVWVRYTTAAAIASVLVGLGRAEPFDELRRLFPKAYAMVKERSWVAVLQGTQEDEEEDEFEEEDYVGAEEAGGEAEGGEGGGEGRAMEIDWGEEGGEEEGGGGLKSFARGKSILVKNESGSLIWDAKIIEVASSKGKATGLRVRYKKWSSRFDEWVSVSFALERTKKNLSLQEELYQQHQKNSGFSTLGREAIRADRIKATSYVDAAKRARGKRAPRSLSKALQVNDMNSSEEVALAKLRAALLVIESALVEGSVDTSDNGVWCEETSNAWQVRVEESRGAAGLMFCVLLLESALKPDTVIYNAAKLISNLPTHSKAVADATLSSVAIRIYMLDKGVNFAPPQSAVGGKKPRLALVNK